MLWPRRTSEGCGQQIHFGVGGQEDDVTHLWILLAAIYVVALVLAWGLTYVGKGDPKRRDR